MTGSRSVASHFDGKSPNVQAVYARVLEIVPRAVKAEQLSAHRYHTKVKLTSPTEVDEELAGWLKDAYDISG